MLPTYAALFLNSSFTYPGLASLDLPSGGAAYPLGAPFARVLFRPTAQVSLISAFFTEDPAPPGSGDPQLRDRHGTAFRLNDHALSITELRYSPAFLKDRGLPGVYTLGGWVATGPFADQLHDAGGLPLASPQSSGIPLTHSPDYAVYAIASQMVWHQPKTDRQGIAVFLNVMHAPQDRNLISSFITGGANWTGPFSGRPNDIAGIAATYAGIGAAARQYSREVVYYTGLGAPFAPSETVIEATYLLQLSSWLSVQPDLQYVIDPGAGIPTPQAPTPLKNAVVVGMRMTLNF
jgi:porin